MMYRVINAVSPASPRGGAFTFAVKNGRFTEVSLQDRPFIHPAARQLSELDDLEGSSEQLFDAGGAMIVPGGVDAHVHSRDPGLTHKEDWRSLAKSAWRGGVTGVCDMPNTVPPTMTRADIEAKLEIAATQAPDLGVRLFVGVGASNIHSVGNLLKDQSLPLAGLKVYYGQSTGDLMYDDLEMLGRSLMPTGQGDERIVVFHSEDQCAIDCAHETHAREIRQASLEGEKTPDPAAFRLHSVIRASAGAHASTKAILSWAKSYGGPVHIAHISTPLEVELLAAAQADGVRVTGEVAPHHLLFCDDDYDQLGGLLKMNPPVRSREEAASLGRLVAQGLLDVYATDHAPHTWAEKMRPLASCPSGVPSLELFYPLLFEVMRRYHLRADKAVAMAAARPASLFGFSRKGLIAAGFDADFVWLSDKPRVIKKEEVVSKCGWTPYDGMTLPRGVLATWTKGRRVHWQQPI
jgi:dihydroorotase